MKTITVGVIRPTVRGKKVSVWHFRWTDPATGKRRTESSGSRDKKVAQRLARVREEELVLESAGIAPVRDVAWKVAVEEFMTTHVVKLRPDTGDLYQRTLDSYGKLMNPGTVQRVTTKLIEDYSAGRTKAGLKPPSVNKLLRHVRAFVKWAYRRRYLRELPEFKGAFVREDQPIPKVVPVASYDKILAILERPVAGLWQSTAWWRTFVVLAYHLGVRRSELLGTTWKSVDWEARTLQVEYATSKSRRSRVLPLTEAPFLVLRQWTANQKPKPSPDDPVLAFDVSLRRLYDDWAFILASAGLEAIRWKDFRSTTASQLLLSGASTVEARDMLGHSNVSVLEKHYANVAGGLRRAAEKRAVELKLHKEPDGEAGVA